MCSSDLFVEGVGYDYEETFVGIFDNKTKLKIANLGVSSYSPKIYLSKIHYFIEKGFFFKHIVIFIDPADILDDSKYILKSDFKIADKTLNKRIERSLNNKFFITDYFIFLSKQYFFKKNNTTLYSQNNTEKNLSNNIAINGRAIHSYSKNKDRKSTRLNSSH